MSTQKALFLLEKQGTYAVRDTDIYKPGPGELLVEIKATGLNPVDWKIQVIGYFVTEYPAVLGTDAAGVIKEVGEGVTGFAVGDKVLYQGWFTNPKATFQQYSIVPADITAKLPSNLSFEQGSTVPLALATAAFGLYSKNNPPSEVFGAGLTPPWEEGGRGKYAGQPILIIGGASAVGQQAIQFAKLSGFSPIITTASSHNTSLLTSLGATHVIPRTDPLASSLAAITSTPISIVYDAISEASTQPEAYAALAPGGTFIIDLPFAVEEAKRDASKIIAHVFGSVHDPKQNELGVSLYAHLTRLLESGEIKPNRIEVVPNGLAGIPDALKKLQEGKLSGTKLVAKPWDT